VQRACDACSVLAPADPRTGRRQWWVVWRFLARDPWWASMLSTVPGTIRWPARPPSRDSLLLLGARADTGNTPYRTRRSTSTGPTPCRVRPHHRDRSAPRLACATPTRPTCCVSPVGPGVRPRGHGALVEVSSSVALSIAAGERVSAHDTIATLRHGQPVLIAMTGGAVPVSRSSGRHPLRRQRGHDTGPPAPPTAGVTARCLGIRVPGRTRRAGELHCPATCTRRRKPLPSPQIRFRVAPTRARGCDARADRPRPRCSPSSSCSDGRVAGSASCS